MDQPIPSHAKRFLIAVDSNDNSSRTHGVQNSGYQTSLPDGAIDIYASPPAMEPCHYLVYQNRNMARIRLDIVATILLHFLPLSARSIPASQTMSTKNIIF